MRADKTKCIRRTPCCLNGETGGLVKVEIEMLSQFSRLPAPPHCFNVYRLWHSHKNNICIIFGWDVRSSIIIPFFAFTLSVEQFLNLNFYWFCLCRCSTNKTLILNKYDMTAFFLFLQLAIVIQLDHLERHVTAHQGNVLAKMAWRDWRAIDVLAGISRVDPTSLHA